MKLNYNIGKRKHLGDGLLMANMHPLDVMCAVKFYTIFEKDKYKMAAICFFLKDVILTILLDATLK